MRRAVFFDRDGTLMEEAHYPKHPSQVRAIPGVAHALEALRRAGWLRVVITNQSGIGRGYLTVEDYESVNAELFRQIDHTIDAAYFCPDPPGRPSSCRKPATGMVEQAVRDHGIDLPGSWFVGDKDVDIECGRNAGCRTILVLTGYGEQHRNCQPEFVFPSVVEAVDWILRAP